LLFYLCFTEQLGAVADSQNMDNGRSPAVNDAVGTVEAFSNIRVVELFHYSADFRKVPEPSN
jgi:hypothetical protein